MLDNHTKARKPSSWRSKPILSIRARLLVLALLAIGRWCSTAFTDWNWLAAIVSTVPAPK